MNKNMMIAMGVVGIVLISGGLLYANSESQQTKMAAEKTAMMKKEEGAKMMKEKEDTIMMVKDKAMDGGQDEMKKNEGIMMMAQGDTASKKATLTDVSGGAGIGKAFILRKDGKLYVTATATLPDPASGTFYEGWLAVKGGNPPKFVDIGKLTKQKDGSYEVSYSSDNVYSGYDMIVVTGENADDQKPEKHILEGLAK